MTMDDKLKELLRSQIESEIGTGDEGYAEEVIYRGKRKKSVKRVGLVAAVFLTAAIGWFGATQMSFSDRETLPAHPEPSPTLSTYNFHEIVSADLTAPVLSATNLVSTDRLLVRAASFFRPEEVTSTVVIVGFNGRPQDSEIQPQCVVKAELQLHSIEAPKGEPTIAVYPSRVFGVEKVERRGELADADGTLISNTPRGEPPEEIPSSGWVSWDVTDIYKQWFIDRHFAGNYEHIAVPRDEIVFAVRDESGEGDGFTASFASREYASLHAPSDAPDVFAPQLRLTIEEGCGS